MIADPLTIPAPTLTYTGNIPAASETGLQAKALNTLEINGRASKRSLSPTDLTTLGLTKMALSVSHAPTNQGRLRSAMKSEAAKADAAGVEHGVTVTLVVDQENKPSAENTAALAKALSALLLVIITGSGSGALTSTSFLQEFLNGEA